MGFGYLPGKIYILRTADSEAAVGLAKGVADYRKVLFVTTLRPNRALQIYKPDGWNIICFNRESNEEPWHVDEGNMVLRTPNVKKVLSELEFEIRERQNTVILISDFDMITEELGFEEALKNLFNPANDLMHDSENEHMLFYQLDPKKFSKKELTILSMRVNGLI